MNHRAPIGTLVDLSACLPGATAAGQYDIEITLLCDITTSPAGSTPFLNICITDTILGTVVSCGQFELDGITPYVPTGTVESCGGGGALSYVVEQICDVSGPGPQPSRTPFQRVKVIDETGAIIAQSDWDMDTPAAPYVVTGVARDCGEEIEQQILCDDTGAFLRKYGRDQNGIMVHANYELDGTTIHATVGTVSSCEGLSNVAMMLCDEQPGLGVLDIPFIRIYVTDDVGNVTTVDDNTLAGTPYTVLGTARRCADDDALEFILCDDNGPFIRNFEVDSNGQVTRQFSYTMTGLAYSPVGTVHACGEAQTEILCDDNGPFHRTLTIEPDTGLVINVENQTLAGGNGYLPVGTVRNCIPDAVICECYDCGLVEVDAGPGLAEAIVTSTGPGQWTLRIDDLGGGPDWFTPVNACGIGGDHRFVINGSTFMVPNEFIFIISNPGGGGNAEVGINTNFPIACGDPQVRDELNDALGDWVALHGSGVSVPITRATFQCCTTLAEPQYALPVKVCGGLTVDVDPAGATSIVLCDVLTNDGDSIPFLRTVFVDGGAITGIVDTDLDGVTPYVPVGAVVDCDHASPATARVLCDDVGPFLAFDLTNAATGNLRTVYATVGAINTPYVPVGTIHTCEQYDVEQVILCDVDPVTAQPTSFVRVTVFDRGDGTPTATSVIATVDLDLAGATYTVTGTVQDCNAAAYEQEILCDVQADGSQVEFIRTYVLWPNVPAVIRDRTLDYSAPYVVTGTVSDCQGPLTICNCVDCGLIEVSAGPGVANLVVTDVGGGTYTFLLDDLGAGPDWFTPMSACGLAADHHFVINGVTFEIPSEFITGVSNPGGGNDGNLFINTTLGPTACDPAIGDRIIDALEDWVALHGSGTPVPITSGTFQCCARLGSPEYAVPVKVCGGLEVEVATGTGAALMVADDNGTFIRRVEVSAGGAVTIVDTDMDGVTPRAVAGTVYPAEAGTTVGWALCDGSVEFIRWFVTDGAGIVQDTYDTDPAGVPIATVASPFSCAPEPRVGFFWHVLCDDNGPFYNRLTRTITGSITFDERTLAGGAYAPVGTVHECGQYDLEQQLLCDDGNGQAFVRWFLYDRGDGNASVANLVGTFDTDLAGAAYTVTGQEYHCGNSGASPTIGNTVASNVQRLSGVSNWTAPAGLRSVTVIVQAVGAAGSVFIDTNIGTINMQPTDSLPLTMTWEVDGEEDEDLDFTEVDCTNAGDSVIVLWTTR